MSSPIIIAANPVVAKVMNQTDEVKNFISEKLSYVVEGHEHMTAFTSTAWNGRSSFFTRRTSTFPAGFLHLIHHELIAAGHSVRIVKKPAPAPLGPENPIVDSFGNDDPRYDFQLRALHQVEKHERGIIRVATGGGKSKIAKLITARYRRMTLFLTTRGVLMYQMKRAFENDCGFNVGVIGDGIWTPTRGINVGMVQTLVAQLKETSLDEEVRDVIAQIVKKDKDLDDKTVAERALPIAQKRLETRLKVRARTIKLLEMFEVVIGEEAHEAGGNSYYEILRHCKNAHVRVALTATPFMRDDAEDNMRLMAAFGPILITVSEKTLIDRGILAKPIFKFVEARTPPKLFKTTSWPRCYQIGYVDNAFMHAEIVRDAVRAAGCGLPVMTLIQRKLHGKIIKDLFQKAGLKVKFLQGENDQEERERGLAALGAGKLNVLIGTTILDVGVDVPAVGLVQLAGGGKAEVALRQRIGRGLRAKKGMPNYCFIVDYTAGKNLTLREHAAQRRAIIEATPGFVENILPAGVDLPWGIFESAAA